MKTMPLDRRPGSQPKQLSLQQLVSRLLVNFQPVAVRHQSFILNDVPTQLLVNTDEEILATIIGSLFGSVINHNRNACIRVSANMNKEFVEIQVRDTYPFEGMSQEFESVKPLAEKLGGFITMNPAKGKAATVSFCFLNAA